LASSSAVIPGDIRHAVAMRGYFFAFGWKPCGLLDSGPWRPYYVAETMPKTANAPTPRLEGRRALVLGLALLACYSYFFYLGGNWNVESRYAQIYALAEHGTLVIDSYPFLPEGGGDAARYEGHYYSDKLIGPSLLAAPVYRAAREVLSATGLPEHRAVYYALRFTNVVTNALPSALLGALLYLFLAQLGLSAALRVWLALAYGLGTLAFPYSTVLFGHQLAAVAIGLAFILLWRQRDEWSPRRALAAGALLGFAAISDVMGLFIAFILGLYAVSLAARHGRATGSVVGRIAPLALFALAVFSVQVVANWASFGNPLTFPHIYHAQESFRARHTAGLFGIHLPQAYPLYQLTVGPWRGLFYSSPVLLLALPGVFLLGRKWRAEAVAIAASYLAVLLIHSGYENWTTGSVFGPRYQIVALPLLIIAAAPAAQRWPLAFRALAVVSIAFMAAVTARSPFVREDLRNPLGAILGEFTSGSLLHWNLGMPRPLELDGLASLVPLVIVVAALLVVLRRQRDS
jgi:hypothetical protein